MKAHDKMKFRSTNYIHLFFFGDDSYIIIELETKENRKLEINKLSRDQNAIFR